MRYALLEPLRGMAALWVFTFHLEFSTAFREACPGLYALFKIGHLGVPMFFVISGFCITASARKTIQSDESVWGFLYRRVRRIYPPYWFSIVVVVSVPFVIEGLSSLKTGQYTAPSAQNLNYGFLDYGFWDWLRIVTLTQVFAVVPGATDLQFKFTTLNAVYWTLALEVQFYFMTALALATRRWFYPVLVFTTAVSVPCMFSTDVTLSGVFLPYWPMFALGCLVYWLLESGYVLTRLLNHRTAWICGLLTVGSVVGFLVYVYSGRPITSLGFAVFFSWVLVVAQGFDAVIFRAMTSPYRILRWPWVLANTIGAMSYSIYLLHSRLRFIATQLLRQFLPGDSIVLDFAIILLTCGMCYGFYLVCERPFAISKSSRRAG